MIICTDDIIPFRRISSIAFDIVVFIIKRSHWVTISNIRLNTVIVIGECLAEVGAVKTNEGFGI